jgi:hypothetical protein
MRDPSQQAEVTIEELRARGRVTEDRTPGNILYPGLGRPCPDCKCFFMNKHDYDNHREVCPKRKANIWNSNQDGSEWCSSSKDPELKALLLQHDHKALMGGFDYALGADEKWIRRRPI